MDNVWNFLVGGAALGLLASAWGKIKHIIWRFVSLFISRVEFPADEAHNALVAYLVAHYPRSRSYDRMYGAAYEHQRDGRYGLVGYEQFGNRSLIFWNGWLPFLFNNAQEQKAARGGNQQQNAESGAAKVVSTLTFVRGTLDVEKILRAACQEMNARTWTNDNSAKQQNRFVIHYVPAREKSEGEWGYSGNGLPWYQQKLYRLITHAPDQLGKAPLHQGQALDGLIFPQRIKNLIQEIELWRNHRAWYQGKGIPWKRGWLLYGPPGTGKTALARAFAEDLNLPIYVFNLAEMSNHELKKAWSDMQVNVPCIALIEDIDNVFHGRDNVARKNGLFPLMMPPKKDDNGEASAKPFTPLTFDCLLNCLDGVDRSDGIFTIITTNDIAKVDPALGQPRRLPDGSVEFISTRPGRIDKAVELSYMEPADKKAMARRILSEYEDEYQKMLAFIDRFASLEETPAQFQERCGQVALARFWKDKQDRVREQSSADTVVEEQPFWQGWIQRLKETVRQ